LEALIKSTVDVVDVVVVTIVVVVVRSVADSGNAYAGSNNSCGHDICTNRFVFIFVLHGRRKEEKQQRKSEVEQRHNES